MNYFRTSILSIFILVNNLIPSYSQINSDSLKVYGVTVDAVDHLNDIVTSLSKLSKKPTARLVFDKFMPASQYVNSCSQIHDVSHVMGCIADSYYMKYYTYQKYIDRLHDYVNTLGSDVDIWEFGNEVNGEWLGSTDTVILKIIQAYSILKGLHKTTALTLFYNYACWENPQNEMFHWVNTYLPDSLKTGIDYVLVSYYEDECNNFQPNWQRVFDSLSVIFPNSKLGIGECGTKIPYLKSSYMQRYYSLKIKTQNYIGGYFWWYFKEDCVPYTLPLWRELNEIWSGTQIHGEIRHQIIKLFGNTFITSPKGQLKFYLLEGADVNVKVYDLLGKELLSPVNGNHLPGEYNISLDTSHIANGVYYVRYEAGSDLEVQKLVLLK